jgi:hypothetical protein
VFRTAIQSGYSRGMDKILQVDLVDSFFPYVETLPIHDDRLTDLCSIISRSGIGGSAIFRRDDKVWQKFKPPRHYNCFLPGTEMQGRFNLGLKSWYSGEVVEITTRSGNTLTITANHPIATFSGFLPANKFQEGDYVFSYGGGIKKRSNPDRVGMSNPFVGALSMPSKHEENSPTSIENIFRSFIDLYGRPARRTPTGPNDLHGDAIQGNGYIEVVATERELLFDVDSAFADCNRNFGLVPMNCNSPLKASDRHLFAFQERVLSGSGGIPRGGALAFDSSTTLLQRRPFEFLRFGPASRLDASRYETGKQNISRIAALNTELLERNALEVAADKGSQVGNVNNNFACFGRSDSVGLLERSEPHSSSPKDSTQAGFADAHFASKLRQGFSGLISPDQIIKIRKYQWSGHVYDLQSPLGWLTANNIVASNCRCGQNPLSIAAAAAKGIEEAVKWKASGIPPTEKAWVPIPNVDLPKGWISQPVMLSLLRYGDRDEITTEIRHRYKDLKIFAA